MKEKFSALCSSTTRINGRFCGFQSQGFSYALFFSIHLIFLFNPLAQENVAVKRFSRQIGQGIVYNWDVQRLIPHFFFWLALFSLILTVLWKLFNDWKLRIRSKEDSEIIRILDSIVIVGCCNFLFMALSFFKKGAVPSVFSLPTVIIDLALLACFLYLLARLSKHVSVDDYLRLILSLFSFSFCAIILLKRPELKSFTGVNLCFIVLSAVIFRISGHFNRIILSSVKSMSVTFCAFPLLTSCYYEMLNILNSHDVFVTHTRIYYAAVSLLYIFLCAIGTIIIHKKKLCLSSWKRLAFPVCILGLSLLSTQQPLSHVYSADIFESANYSILISDFLQYGKIPIVSHYGGHMMSGVWQGFLYATLNRDNFGAIFSPYWAYLEMPLITLLFFYFAKIYIGETQAFLSVLTLPLSGWAWSYYGLGMLLPLAAAAFIREKSLSKGFCIWISFVWITLYRLDLGFAFFMATIISLSLYICVSRDWLAAKLLLISLLASVIAGLAIWSLLCLQQQVNPILRFLEFVKVSSSNQTWAYNNIGDPGRIAFIWSYILIPFSVCFCIAQLVVAQRFRTSIPKDKWFFLIAFGLSYIFNFPRGLTRHSLAENASSIILWCALPFLSAFSCILVRKKQVFLPLLSILIITSYTFFYSSTFNESPLSAKLFLKIEQMTDEKRSVKKQRVIFSQIMKDWCDSYKTVMDALLTDDETFLDFMNRSFVYSAIGRICPVYIAQTPLMLSGEFTQEMFIKEIQDYFDMVPLAILPLDNNRASFSVDGIPNSLRHYKLAEFIYEHYTPLCKYGDFAVWCNKTKYSYYIQKIVDSELLSSNLDREGKGSVQLINYGYDDGLGFHRYNLHYLPYLWASKDIKKAVDLPVLKALATNTTVIHIPLLSEQDKEKGNYILLHFQLPEEEGMYTAVFGKESSEGFTECFQMQFTVLKGKTEYLLRPSVDYYWYTGEINSMKILPEQSPHVPVLTEALLLSGD